MSSPSKTYCKIDTLQEICIWRKSGTTFWCLDLFTCKIRQRCHEVATKLNLLHGKDSLCLTSLPTPIHKGTHKGGRREAPPPLWMGVGRLVRHKESCMGPTSSHLCYNFGAASSDLAYKRKRNGSSEMPESLSCKKALKVTIR